MATGYGFHCHQSEGTMNWYLLIALQQFMSGCDRFICISFKSAQLYLSAPVSPVQPAPFPALFSDFSFKNLSRFSIKHFIFMASISDAKSFLCDSFMLVYVWSGTLLLSAMLFTRLLGGLKAEDLPDSFCFPHKHLTELKTTKSTHICPK